MLMSNTLSCAVFNSNAYCLSVILHTAARHIPVLILLYLCLAQEFIVVILQSHNDCRCLICQLKSATWYPKIRNSESFFQIGLSHWAVQHTPLTKPVPDVLNRDLACCSLCMHIYTIFYSHPLLSPQILYSFLFLIQILLAIQGQVQIPPLPNSVHTVLFSISIQITNISTS